ncbi:MAG: hypothetical protein ACXIVG_09390 [Pararhodobacter sp.]
MSALRLVLIPLLLWLTALPALAQGDPIIITWNTNTENGAHDDDPDPLAGVINGTIPELTALPILRHGVTPHNNPAAHAHSSVNWPETEDFDDLDLDHYLSWGFETEIPYLFSEMVIHIRRSGTGPKDVRLVAIIDGNDSAPVHLLDASPPDTGNGTPFPVVPDPTTYPDGIPVTASIEFRLYGWDAGSSSSGVFSFRNAGTTNAQRANPPITGRAIVIRGRPALADLEAEKDVMVFSEDGSACNDPSASPPTEPENPAAIPGACIQYTISVQNTGPVAAQAVNLTDALPASLTLVNAVLNGWDETGPDFAFNFIPGCSGGTCGVEVQNGIIPANTTATLTIRATIN